MPWYKIEFSSRASEESKQHVEYEFVDHVLSDEEETELFEAHSWPYVEPIGFVKIIDSLPTKIREHFIADYKQDLKHATEMLNVLWTTPSA